MPTIADGCASGVCVRCRFGFLMCGRGSSPRRPSGRLVLWPQPMAPVTISSSSSRSRRPGSKGRRHRAGRRRGVCLQAAPGAHRPGRSLRRDRLGHGLSVDHDSGRCAAAAPAGGRRRRQRAGPRLLADGRQADDGATIQRTRGGRPLGRRDAPAAGVVQAVFVSERRCMSWLNVGEVAYQVERRHGGGEATLVVGRLCAAVALDDVTAQWPVVSRHPRTTWLDTRAHPKPRRHGVAP